MFSQTDAHEVFHEESLDQASKEKALQEDKPQKRSYKPRKRTQPELWAVVEHPEDGSQEAYTLTMKAIHRAGELGVETVKLCRIAPKTRGFKVVEVVRV